MNKLITYSRVSFFLILTFFATQSFGVDASWGVKSKFVSLLQKKLQKDPVAKDFFDQDWNVKGITRNASTYTTALNNAIKDKSLFETSTDAQATKLFADLFKFDGAKIIWKPTLTDQNLNTQLTTISTAIKNFILSRQGLTPEKLVKPCCQSDERLKIFSNWVKVDPTKNAITIENLTNDDKIINQALVDIAATLNIIEDSAYYDRVLPAYDQRGVSTDSNNIFANLTNLELRIAALEGQKQTFCCSDEECALNCPNATTMTGTTCTINPECKPHPSSIVDLKTDKRKRTENIIKRAIALFPLYTEADFDEPLSDETPAGNICLSCPKKETARKTPDSESLEVHYNILVDDEDSELSILSLNPPTDSDKTSHDLYLQFTNPKSTDAIELKKNISTLTDSSDPLQRKVLHYAVDGCNTDQPAWIQYVIENGAQDQVDAPRADGNTPLHIVAQLAQKQTCNPNIIQDMIAVLKINGADETLGNSIDPITSPNAGTAKACAIFTTYYSGDATAEKQLSNGAANQYKTITNNQFMPAKPDDFIPKTFFEAAITGDYQTMEKQVNVLKKANKLELLNMPDYLDTWQRTALHYAASGCTQGHAKIVKLLVDNGANANARSSQYYYLDEQGIKSVSGYDTPLHAASGAALLAESQDQTCEEGALAAIAKTLLDNKADPHAQNAEGRRAFDISALALTQNTEASTILMNYALQPCTALATLIQQHKPIDIDTIGACINALKFIEGTHVNYDEKGNPIYYCTYDKQAPENQKLYFLETIVSQLEGIYGFFNPMINDCKKSYAFTAQEKSLNDLGFDFIKIMQATDSSAQNLPTLFTAYTDANLDCRRVNCALRLLRVFANMVQPDTALTDTASDQKQ